ncbi:oxidoreductase [Paenibacillus sp. F411]|uniref:NAD dependent epimerase/dehydratase family protein n=1 Tax=Paenibacillus algicola TaxID=2565926 RepID=A0A4P8XIU1_9BACL|nr:MULTISPECIES: oxidoreductase [Paenibacillus]MBO2945399.1 oxidoreductase [Paenibacillus sp. F411]QCT01241.1 NAD dependent epimerase/dehydratase family protein [Paenibacillus algicola]
MGITSLVMGATGLVGQEVTRQLLASDTVEEVRILVRREPDYKHPKLNVILVDWDELPRYKKAFEGVDQVFSCLGTTIKKAGSQEAFRKVDEEYVLSGAALALESGVPQFLAVSSMGASRSSKAFYSRVKGEVEEALSHLPFQGVHLFRPSLLLGDRSERRLGEDVASVLMRRLDFLFRGKLAPYRAVPASKVARAMVNISFSQTRGTHVYPNDVIHVLGDDTIQEQ